MSRLVKVSLALITLLALAGLANRLYDVMTKDPFARLRRMTNLGIELKGVTAKYYESGKLTGTAHFDKVELPQDHQMLNASGIKNGLISTKDGPITFSSEQAAYNATLHQLTVPTPSHVTANGLDATASSFYFDQQSSIGKMPGVVTGTLKGGQFTGKNLTYNAKTGGYKVQKIDWIGIPPVEAGAEAITQAGQGQSTRTKWHISGGVMFLNGIATYDDIRADDGEILVTAPKGVLDQHTDILTLSGPVHYYSDKANCVCDKAVIYRREKKAVLTGHVHMLVKPKDEEKLQVSEIPPWRPPVPAAVAASRPAAPQNAEVQQQKDLDDELRSSKTTRKYPAHIKADEITYWYAKGSRHATIQGSPDCYQEFPGGRWRRVVTHDAFYDGEKDQLTLNSTNGTKDTRMVDSLGDDLVAEKFVVSTKEDDEEYSGQAVDGVVSSDDEDLPQTKNGGMGGAAPASPAAPPGAPPKSGRVSH